jgi:ribosomal protein S18 acetylase RimI-like enzyme
MQLQIKIASESDAEKIEALLSESFAEFKPVYTKEAYEATAIKCSGILERIHEGPLWIALIDGIIIGTVSAVSKDGSLYIRGMAVHPEARGKGAGEKLLREVEEYAASIKINRLFLGTTEYLESAIRLYERMGFKGKSWQDFYGMRLLIMEKFLNE